MPWSIATSCHSELMLITSRPWFTLVANEGVGDLAHVAAGMPTAAVNARAVATLRQLVNPTG